MIDGNDLASSLSSLFLCSCVNVTIVSNLLCNEKKGYRS